MIDHDHDNCFVSFINDLKRICIDWLISPFKLNDEMDEHC